MALMEAWAYPGRRGPAELAASRVNQGSRAPKVEPGRWASRVRRVRRVRRVNQGSRAPKVEPGRWVSRVRRVKTATTR